MIYLDSSALVTLVSGRQYAVELVEYLTSHPGVPMSTSTLGFVETVRTLDAIGTYPDVMQELLRSFTEILLTAEVRDTAALVPPGARSLDAIHIASAKILGDSLTVLISYDKRMLDISRKLGLPTASPGLGS